LIFAKSDSHADDIIQIVREEFNEGNDFCKKVTYKSEDDPDTVLANFRNAYNPRVAVTVDMIATGTDVKPLELLLFMRDVKSRNYYEQMKGRGTRTYDADNLRKVTPSAATNKTHFVIVDAVGVSKSLKTSTQPLERQEGRAAEGPDAGRTHGRARRRHPQLPGQPPYADGEADQPEGEGGIRATQRWAQHPAGGGRPARGQRSRDRRRNRQGAGATGEGSHRGLRRCRVPRIRGHRAPQVRADHRYREHGPGDLRGLQRRGHRQGTGDREPLPRIPEGAPRQPHRLADLLQPALPPQGAHLRHGAGGGGGAATATLQPYPRTGVGRLRARDGT
jgi:hypothetical protein